ncbi:MAG TPA: L-threonine 3-dehydrogenase [Planctomycetota bacterium]|nr:L-threonine 3-dehydrogenase [Planctomycetota bacterium]
MTKTMRAIRKLAPEPGLTLCTDVPVPEVGPHDVLIQVETASVCGTDLHIYRWDEWSQHRIKPPLTLGHEFAGTVVETGDAVENIRTGEFVSAESHITCGMCFQCRTGQAHMCPQTKILGVDRDGAFAEFVSVPSSVIWRNDRTKIPPEIATLQEPFGNAVFATLAHELPGQSVAVFGCGPIGLFSIAIARASGAARIFASDVNSYRLQLAKKMGANFLYNPRAEALGVTEWFLSQNSGSGVDIALEMSGSPEGIANVFRVVRNGGRVSLFGIPAKAVELDVAENIIFKNLTVLGLNGRKIFETWFRTRWLLESGVVDLHPLITLETTLEDFEEAFSRLSSGKACKIILKPQTEPMEVQAPPLEETEMNKALGELNIHGKIIHR